MNGVGAAMSRLGIDTRSGRTARFHRHVMGTHLSMNDERNRPWLERQRRPDGVDDATVNALGKLGEAVEWIERARGRLYDFHQMSGRADLLLGEAADELDAAGHTELADRLRTDGVGRNVIEGRWTFQIVEEYDATYWDPIRTIRADAEEQLVAGRRHVNESEMKERRRTAGHRHHESRPPTAD